MDRRTFLKNWTATGGALAAAGLLGNQSKAQGGPPRNTLFGYEHCRLWYDGRCRRNCSMRVHRSQKSESLR